MKNPFVFIGLIVIFHQTAVAQHVATNQLPSSSENQVTFSSYREHPFSQWSFRNAGAPMHVLMMPRAGKVHAFGESPDAAIAKAISTDTQGNSKTFETIFSDNYADGVVVLKENNILYEKYRYKMCLLLIVSALCTSSDKIVTEITLIQLNISKHPYRNVVVFVTW